MDRHFPEHAILDPPRRRRTQITLRQPNAARLRQDVHEQREMLQQPMPASSSEYRHRLFDPLPKWAYSGAAPVEDCLWTAHEDFGCTARLANEGSGFYRRRATTYDRDHFAAEFGIIRNHGGMARKFSRQGVQHLRGY